jgi:predicted anti-sigma-YlaC factor YlaD
MHSVVVDRLEEYLAGVLNPVEQREIEDHLGACASCREEVRSMQEIGELFESLRSEDVIIPSPGFYAGVMEAAQTSRPSFLSLFGLDWAFGRRLAFASLLALAVLGSYFVSGEADFTVGPTPVSMMAQDHETHGPDRDVMLVTLATYEP